MYSWIWRHLPGSRAVKLLEALLIVAAVVAVLMLVAFPWVEPRLPFNEVTAG
jgi:competence protein ComGC